MTILLFSTKNRINGELSSLNKIAGKTVVYRLIETLARHNHHDVVYVKTYENHREYIEIQKASSLWGLNVISISNINERPLSARHEALLMATDCYLDTADCNNILLRDKKYNTHWYGDSNMCVFFITRFDNNIINEFGNENWMSIKSKILNREKCQLSRNIASIKDLLRCQNDFLETNTAPTAFIPAKQIRPGVYVEPSVKIHRSANIMSPSYICKGSKIGANTTIGPNTVVGPNSKICDDVTTEDCCIDKDSYIDNKSVIKNCFLVEGVKHGIESNLRVVAVPAKKRVS